MMGVAVIVSAMAMIVARVVIAVCMAVVTAMVVAIATVAVIVVAVVVPTARTGHGHLRLAARHCTPTVCPTHAAPGNARNMKRIRMLRSPAAGP
jgi:hypothetical protein